MEWHKRKNKGDTGLVHACNVCTNMLFTSKPSCYIHLALLLIRDTTRKITLLSMTNSSISMTSCLKTKTEKWGGKSRAGNRGNYLFSEFGLEVICFCPNSGRRKSTWHPKRRNTSCTVHVSYFCVHFQNRVSRVPGIWYAWKTESISFLNVDLPSIRSVHGCGSWQEGKSTLQQ